MCKGFYAVCDKLLITRAGTPAANVKAGIDRVTTAPAPITLPRPIVTPRKTITRVPSQTSDSIRTGAAFAGECATPWKSLSRITVSSPISALSPMLISRLQAIRTPWFMKTFFPKFNRASRAQEISTILCLRDRIVMPSPTSIFPSELVAQGPSTDKSLPTAAHWRLKRHDHHRILSNRHTFERRHYQFLCKLSVPCAYLQR